MFNDIIDLSINPLNHQSAISLIVYLFIKLFSIYKTLCALVHSVYCKQSSSDTSIEVVDILVGVDNADCQMRVSIILNNNIMLCLLRISLKALENFSLKIIQVTYHIIMS